MSRVDLGVDAGGITRNIARGISTSGILTEEQKERDWHWICRSFGWCGCSTSYQYTPKHLFV